VAASIDTPGHQFTYDCAGEDRNGVLGYGHSTHPR
jgi:hypothetical protein